jgi:hypothetical protein
MSQYKENMWDGVKNVPKNSPEWICERLEPVHKSIDVLSVIRVNALLNTVHRHEGR